MRNQSLWSYNKFLARKKHRMEEIEKLKSGKTKAKFVELTYQQSVENEKQYEQYLTELKPIREELGLLTKEELSH